MTKTESPVLRRLGPIPFWRGETRCLAELAKIYDRAMTRAREELQQTTQTQALHSDARGSTGAGR